MITISNIKQVVSNQIPNNSINQNTKLKTETLNYKNQISKANIKAKKYQIHITKIVVEQWFAIRQTHRHRHTDTHRHKHTHKQNKHTVMVIFWTKAILKKLGVSAKRRDAPSLITNMSIGDEFTFCWSCLIYTWRISDDLCFSTLLISRILEKQYK